MQGKISFINDEYYVCNYSIESDIDYGYKITIDLNLEDKFENIINNYPELEKSIDEQINFLLDIDKQNKEEVQFLLNCKKNVKDLLTTVEYIEFNYDIKDVIKYLRKNSKIKNKKIIINEEFGLDSQKIEMLKQEFNSNINNLYFELSNNTNIINYDECRETYHKIDEMVKKIESFNFSPIEKIMYTYDLVRNKVYIDVNEEEDKSISRDLSSVLLGDKIVCLGYAKVFETLLERIGIESKLIVLYNTKKKEGHARNGVYIKDDKYNIDGFYYFDATWDSKIKEGDNSYLLSYRFFAKNKEEMDEIDNGKFIDEYFPYFSPYMAEELKELLKVTKLEELPKKLVKSINYMSHAITKKFLLDYSYLTPISPFYGKLDIEKLIVELDEITEYFNKPIYADTLLEVLYNVRRQQYYESPDTYQFTLNDFYRIAFLSNWKFSSTPEEEFLNELLNHEKQIKIKKRKLINYSKKHNLDKNIECVRHARKNNQD